HREVPGLLRAQGAARRPGGEGRDAVIADPPHIDVGAYALGLLEEPDRRAFEAHLRACPACHDELGMLRGIARTLDGIAPIAEPADAPPAPPEPAVVADLLRH